MEAVTGPSLAGKLLVATPSLEDPNFHRTVVLVVAHHADEGALGLVINRPSELEVARALPEWAPLAAPPVVVFAGGPVTPDGVICLGRTSAAPGPPDAPDSPDRGETAAVTDGWETIAGDDGLGVVDLNIGPERFASTVAGVRVYAGHSGWGARQLEGELAAGGWFVVEREPDDALSMDPSELWRRVLERQPPKVAMFAKAPPHLSLN